MESFVTVMAFTASERLDLEDFANNLLNAIMTWTSVKNRTHQSVLASRFLEKSILKISRKQCFLFPLRETIESYECGKKIRKHLKRFIIKGVAVGSCITFRELYNIARKFT